MNDGESSTALSSSSASSAGSSYSSSSSSLRRLTMSWKELEEAAERWIVEESTNDDTNLTGNEYVKREASPWKLDAELAMGAQMPERMRRSRRSVMSIQEMESMEGGAKEIFLGKSVPHEASSPPSAPGLIDGQDRKTISSVVNGRNRRLTSWIDVEKTPPQADAVRMVISTENAKNISASPASEVEEVKEYSAVRKTRQLKSISALELEDDLTSVAKAEANKLKDSAESGIPAADIDNIITSTTPSYPKLGRLLLSFNELEKREDERKENMTLKTETGALSTSSVNSSKDELVSTMPIVKQKVHRMLLSLNELEMKEDGLRPNQTVEAENKLQAKPSPSLITDVTSIRPIPVQDAGRTLVSLHELESKEGLSSTEMTTGVQTSDHLIEQVSSAQPKLDCFHRVSSWFNLEREMDHDGRPQVIASNPLTQEQIHTIVQFIRAEYQEVSKKRQLDKTETKGLLQEAAPSTSIQESTKEAKNLQQTHLSAESGQPGIEAATSLHLPSQEEPNQIEKRPDLSSAQPKPDHSHRVSSWFKLESEMDHDVRSRVIASNPLTQEQFHTIVQFIKAEHQEVSEKRQLDKTETMDLLQEAAPSTSSKESTNEAEDLQQSHLFEESGQPKIEAATNLPSQEEPHQIEDRPDLSSAQTEQDHSHRVSSWLNLESEMDHDKRPQVVASNPLSPEQIQTIVQFIKAEKQAGLETKHLDKTESESALEVAPSSSIQESSEEAENFQQSHLSKESDQSDIEAATNSHPQPQEEAHLKEYDSTKIEVQPEPVEVAPSIAMLEEPVDLKLKEVVKECDPSTIEVTTESHVQSKYEVIDEIESVPTETQVQEKQIEVVSSGSLQEVTEELANLQDSDPSRDNNQVEMKSTTDLQIISVGRPDEIIIEPAETLCQEKQDDVATTNILNSDVIEESSGLPNVELSLECQHEAVKVAIELEPAEVQGKQIDSMTTTLEDLKIEEDNFPTEVLPEMVPVKHFDEDMMNELNIIEVSGTLDREAVGGDHSIHDAEDVDKKESCHAETEAEGSESSISETHVSPTIQLHVSDKHQVVTETEAAVGKAETVLVEMEVLREDEHFEERLSVTDHHEKGNKQEESVAVESGIESVKEIETISCSDVALDDRLTSPTDDSHLEVDTPMTDGARPMLEIDVVAADCVNAAVINTQPSEDTQNDEPDLLPAKEDLDPQQNFWLIFLNNIAVATIGKEVRTL